MKILVCGGRAFSNRAALFKALAAVHARKGITCVIHGAAPGADSLAGEWASRNGIPQQVFRADWKLYGKSAGPIRNRQMLCDGKPDGVVAFPGGRGTANMVKQATEAGLKVWEVNCSTLSE